MSYRETISAMRRWLPYPVYLFEGGPFDGQRRTVELIETGSGMVAPEIWNLAEMPEPPKPTSGPSASVENLTVRRHSYRFVSDRGSMNEGRYAYIAA